MTTRTYKERAALIPTNYSYRRAVAHPEKGEIGMTWSVEELWDYLPAEEAAVLMVSCGTVNGKERFTSSVIAREGNNLVKISTGGDIGRGNIVVRYPLDQGRTIRLLVSVAVTEVAAP